MEIKRLISDNIWDYENGFYWFSSPSRINKLLYHFELYKTVLSVPGDILEFGVFKGSSLIRFCQFRDALENNYTREVIGFDLFGEFPTQNIMGSFDLEFIQKFSSNAGSGISKDQLESILYAKGFSNFRLVDGNIFETLEGFLKENPEQRISLLHLDLDVAEPTEYCLETLFDRVVKGGLIVIDDYNDVVGTTQVVDRFIAKNDLTLETLKFYGKPVFIRKT